MLPHLLAAWDRTAHLIVLSQNKVAKYIIHDARAVRANQIFEVTQKDMSSEVGAKDGACCGSFTGTKPVFLSSRKVRGAAPQDQMRNMVIAQRYINEATNKSARLYSLAGIIKRER